jgi:uncharacterized protein (UPF0548 family)
MFSLAKPSRDSINKFITLQQLQKFSYPEVGLSRMAAPTGYILDHNRIKLGEGAETFDRAKRAINRWKMFDLPWLELCWPEARIEPGVTVAVLVSHLGFWSLNASRIVYVVDEPGPTEKYGFAYGTLPGHAEVGEERFTVEFDSADQSVWYDIYAFSRPTALARLAYPFARSLQERFAADSKAAVLRAAQKS